MVIINFIGRLFLSVLLVSVSSAAVAEVYKWVDENGVVNYSESLPPDTKGGSVDIAPGPSQQSIDEARKRHQTLLEQERLQESRDKQKETAPENALASPAKTKHCVDLQGDIWNLEDFRPVYLDESGVMHSQASEHSLYYEGERTYIKDADRPALINRLKGEYKNICQPIESEMSDLVEVQMEENLKENCKRAKLRLEEMKRPDAHVVGDDIDKFKRLMERMCKEKK